MLIEFGGLANLANNSASVTDIYAFDIGSSYILAEFDSKLGLTATMPNLYQLKSATYDNATVTLQQVKSFDYGQGHQRWHHNPITQMIEAFSTDIFDKGERNIKFYVLLINCILS